jgi:hypothetical protein
MTCATVRVNVKNGTSDARRCEVRSARGPFFEGKVTFVRFPGTFGSIPVLFFSLFCEVRFKNVIIFVGRLHGAARLQERETELLVDRIFFL